jgi:hypothetical protein
MHPMIRYCFVVALSVSASAALAETHKHNRSNWPSKTEPVAGPDTVCVDLLDIAQSQ